jgi:hypothetical protein
LELPDLYLPVVTVWLIILVVPPPPESTSLVVLVPLALLDVLAGCQRSEGRKREETRRVPKLAAVKVGIASVGSGRG